MRAGRSPLMGVGVCVVSLCLVVAGCSTAPTEDTEPVPSASASPTASEDGETPAASKLAVAAYGDKREVSAYESIVERFDAARQDLTMSFTAYPDEAAAAAAILRARADGEVPDVFLVGQDHLAQIVGGAVTQPVGGLLDGLGLNFGDDYQRVALNQFSNDGALQCMPVEMSPHVVFYNRALTELSDFPDEPLLPETGTDTWSWTEFEALSRVIAFSDGSGGIRGGHVPADVDLIGALIRSNGSDIVDDVSGPSALQLSSEEAVEVLLSVGQFNTENAVSLTDRMLEERNAKQWFKRGSLGFYFGTRADIPGFRKRADLDFDIVGLPSFGRSRGASQSTAFCISSTTAYANQAAQFLAATVGPTAGDLLVSSGTLVPSRLESLLDPAFVEPGEAPINMDAFGNAQRRSDPGPYSPVWPEVKAQTERFLAELFADRSQAALLSYRGRLREFDDLVGVTLASAQPDSAEDTADVEPTSESSSSP